MATGYFKTTTGFQTKLLHSFSNQNTFRRMGGSINLQTFGLVRSRSVSAFHSNIPAESISAIR